MTVLYMILVLVVFCMYTVLSFTTNLLLFKYVKGFKLPMSKKYIDKKETIYKVQKRDYNDFYSIQKWELSYGQVNEFYLIFILGAGLFKSYGYRYVNEFGIYSKIDLGKLTDLKSEYEKEASFVANLLEKPISDLDRLNKRFNSNYIE